MHLQYYLFDVKFSGQARFFEESISYLLFLNHAFYVGVSQIIQKLVLYEILVVYPHIR